ncbi:hypothetical protein FISHEDRAFT_28679, partial [Fistulina hepatica ATCC 64428]
SYSSSTLSVHCTMTDVVRTIRHGSSPAHFACHSTALSHSICIHRSPQCCHCGWRGSHAPDCPFR